MQTIRIVDEYIRLGQAMKKAGLVENGAEAKALIQGGQVEVNGEIQTQRGKKLHPGDQFSYHGETVVVSS